MKRTIDSDDDDIEDESFDFDVPRKKKVEIVPKVIADDISWLQKYSPAKTIDVCVNPSKVKQLRQVMQKMAVSHQPRILVVTGPSGSGKSTLCKTLSHELAGGFVEYSESMNFEEFLNDGRYLVGKNMKFLIVEELPNVFHRDTLNKFRDSLTQWVYLRQTLPPLVICLTELERSFTEGDQSFFSIENNLNINTLLPKSLLMDLRVDNVKFNAVSKKFIKSCIDRIVAKERLASLIPKPQLSSFLEYIYQTGDIRSSINTLELWSRFYVKNGVDINRDYGFFLGRNVSISLFHALGKIIYSSSKYQGLDQEESNYKTIEDVIDNYDNFSLLNLSLLENYGSVVGDSDLHIVSKMAEALSASDLIYSLGEGKEYMCRSIRNDLGNHKATGETGKSAGKVAINFTKNLSMIRRSNQVAREIRGLKDAVIQTSFANINMMDGCYVSLILNKRQRAHYGRIGGRIDIHLEDNIYDNDNDKPIDVKAIQELYGGLHEEVEDELTDEIDDSDRKSNPFESDYEFSDDSDFI